MKIIAMIPARYGATRFPGKLMADLGGKPVIVRTYEATKTSNIFDEVYVVTDSAILVHVVQEDTLYIHGDTLCIEYDTSGVHRSFKYLLQKVLNIVC